jgi:metal-responsive CopG/Arc/MetJ family transcriptional regulator
MSEQRKKNHVSVRLEPEILSRVDALIVRFTTSRHVGTRSDVVRAVILGGLERRKDEMSTPRAPK